MLKKIYSFLAILCIVINSLIASATSFTNTTSISILDEAPASLYPSPITVAGMSGVITNLTVTINNFNHTYAHDVSIILQAPTGQSLLLQSGIADQVFDPAVGLTYTFSDAALAQMSDVALWTSGSYKPTGYFWDLWTAPAPPTPPGAGTYNTPGPFGGTSSTLGSVFNGLNPNGQWKLFVADFAVGDAGSINGGWSIDITTSIITPVNLSNFSVTKQSNQALLNWSTLNETNLNRFVIEQSADGKVFNSVGFLEANGNTFVKNDYSYVVSLLPGLTNYFRLNMIDNDLTSTYSAIQTIQVDERNNLNHQITQMSNGTISIMNNEIIKAVIVFDMAGRTVVKQDCDSKNCIISKSSDLISGIYFIRVQTETSSFIEKISLN